ncbi:MULTISPECIES: DUF3859 domain-containing protein [unclassified Bradyrhizobium]|uniref:DUF3859 domain-containing protein n=1 Tax=unclassified Bradyrhizobium TaxID=2631580 RepID=UPI0028E3AFC3|nr:MULTISPECIES: DUF3859 domain-containing protein [unclassified Bradyrhizobium]
MFRVIGPTVLLLSLFVTAPATAQTVQSIDLQEYGIFDGQRAESGRGNSTNPDYAGLVLRTKTDRIPATLGVKFGVAYVPVGSPIGAPVKLSLVTRFPPAGILDAAAKRHQKEEIVKTAVIGSPSYRIFEFDAPWRILPGDWVFEFYSGNRKVGEKHFTVFDPKG